MPVDLSETYDALYRRAIAAISIGQTEEAFESLWRIVRRLTRLQPETLDRRQSLQRALETAWFSLVQFLQWEKRLDEAIAACEAVRAHLPNQRAVRRLAGLRIERGEVEEGLAQMREAVDAAPTVPAWVELASTYMDLERYEEAERCCQSALAAAQSNEDAVLANLTLFSLYRQSERVGDALDAWSMATVLEPEIADGVANVYGWLIERGDLAQAERYVDREPNALRRTFYRGVLHWAAGREGEARAQWQRVLAMDAHDEDADLEAWIEAALRVGEPEHALEHEADVTRGGPALATNAAVMLALAHSLAGHDQEAQSWITEIERHLERGWPTLDPIDGRRMEALRSLAQGQPQILGLLDRIAERD